MVYSDTTNKNGAIQFIESLCKLGDGGITGDATLFKQITSYFNQSCKEIEIALLRVDDNFKWDDFNYTDFPIATINLVDNQRDYSLPAATSGGNASTLWKVNRVRIMDNSGLYHTIRTMNVKENESDDGAEYAGIPDKYRFLGSSIRLSPVPKAGDVTLTNGLEIQFQRSGVDFTTSDTTKQPGFIDAYHDLPCYNSAYMYLLPINMDLALRYKQIVVERLRMLQDDWTNRSQDAVKRMIPAYSNSK